MARLGSASRWAVRAAVSVVAVWLLLRVIPLETVVAAVRRTSPWVWMGSLCVFFLGHFVNALKLRLLLGRPRPPVALAVRAQYAGLVANLGLPGLAGGDLVRAAYLARASGTGRVALASIADRGVDTVAVLVLVAVAAPIAGLPGALRSSAVQAGWWTAVVAVGVAGALVAAWLMRHRSSLAARLARAGAGLAERRAAILAALALSLAVQSAFVMTNVWLAAEAGVSTGIASWFVAWPLSKLVATLPVSLGGIGVREAALVSLLAPYGAERDAVLASGILWQAVLAVSGLVGLALSHAFAPFGAAKGD